MCKLFVFLGLIASATSKGTLIQDQIPKCSSECAVTGIHKFFYIPSKTYTYDYKVKIIASLEGVKSIKETWHDEVELSWISPCDVVVSVRSSELTSKENGNQTHPFVGEFPLVAAISAGVVQKICHHAEDPVESVNFKKGIVSILQNSLPSFSMIYNNKSIHELDAVGVCPTLYKIESKESLFVVNKFKDHKDCSARHYDFETLLNKFIFASYIPISKSESNCRQEIKDGIIQRVSCTNEDDIRLSKGKYLKFEQNSELQYVSEKHKMPQNLSDIKTFVRSNLMSRVYSEGNSDQFVKQKIDIILSVICNSTGRDFDQITPQLVTDVIDLLRNVKTETLIYFYSKMASKQTCHNFMHLKSIFFDALPYITREGSLKMMIHQILSGHATAFRRELYIASIFFWPHLNEETMEYLLPVFRHPSSASQTLSFVSANLVRKFCKTHGNYHAQSPSVKVVFKELGKELQTFCPLSSVSEVARSSSITALKAIGNMGYMDSQLQHYIFKCITSKKSDTAVQVAGVESFRLIECSNELTVKLLRVATNVGNKAEIRTTAFLEVLRCADEQNLKKMLTVISIEKNKSVKSFVVSHLNRIMAGSFPHSNKVAKEFLLLHSNILPRVDPNSSSKSFDFEYYFKSIGAGIDANFDASMFSELSTLKYEAKLSTSYLFQVLDPFAISIRIENFKDIFPYIMEQLSKSESGFIKIIKPFLLSFLEENGIDWISKESKESGSNITAKSRIDVQVKLFGVDVLYMSFQNDSLLFKENFFKSLWTEITASSHTLETALKALSSTRALNFKLKAFIPSIHGISLLTSLQTTTLIGLNIEQVSNDTICTKDNSMNCMILTPKFSSLAQIFIGYDLKPFFGINVTNNVDLSEDVRYHLETKEGQLKMYLLTPKEDLDILTASSNIRLLPENGAHLMSKALDSRLTKETCLNSMSNLHSFNFCWNFNIPNIDTNTNVPLTFYTFKFYARKNNPNVTRIETTSSWNYRKNCLEINTKFSSDGHLPHPNSMDLKVNFIDKEKYSSISTYLSSRNDDLGLGMKISLEKTSTKRGYKNDVSVYVSNTARFTSCDKILYVKYIRGSEEDNTTVDIKMQTVNAFASIFKFSFEAEFDYTSKERSSAPQVPDSEANRTTSHAPLRIPLKKSLGMHLKDVMDHPFNKKSVLLSMTLRRLSFKKLNFELESGAIHTNLFIQRVTSDHISSQYRFWATAKVGHIKETIKGDVAFKGYKDDRSITISSDIFSESSTSNCHIKTELVDNNRKFDCRFTVENLNSKEVILMAKYSKERKSPNNIHFATNAEILVNGYIPHYVLTGEVAETQLGTYLINYVVKKNEDLQATIKGEIGLHSDINFIKERIHLNYTATSGSSYALKGGYEFSHYKDKVALSLVTLNKQLLYARFALYRFLDCKDCFTYSYQIQLPKILNGTVDGEMRLTELKSTSLLTVLPQSSDELTLKSSCFVNFVQKQLEARLSYEVNRKKEKFEMNSHYDIASERRFVHLKGSLNAFSEEYRYNLEGSLGTPYDNDTNRHLLVGLFKPTGENYIFEALYHKDVFDDFKGDVTTKFHLLTFKGEEFKWNSNFCYAFDSNNTGLVVMGRAEFKTPLVDDVATQFETNLSTAEHQKFFIVKMNVTNKKFLTKSTLKIGFRLFPQERKNESFILDTLKPFEFHFDLLNWGQKGTNLSIQIDTNKENDFLFSIDKNGNRNLGLKLKQEREKEFAFHVFTPSETVEFAFKISFKEVTLTLYPNHEWRNARFDLKKLNAINILSNMAIEQTTMQGNINVNGTTSGSELILVSIESIKLSNGSYKTEAIFRSTYLKTNPRILLETVFTPSTKSLCLSFRQSSSAPSSVMIGGVYSTHPYLAFQKTFYGYITSPKTTIELTSNHINLATSDVDHAGYSLIDGTLNSSSMGVVHYSTCYSSDPVTLIMKTSSVKESSEVTTYLGDFERHLSIKFNKINTKDYDNRDDVALKISSKLHTPSFITIEYFYNLIELKSYADSVWRDLKKMFHLSREVADELFDEVFSKSMESNSQKSKFQRVVREVSNELKYLYQETQLDQLFPDFSFWKMELRKLLEDTLEIFTAVTDKIRQMMTEYLLKIYETLISEFEAFNRLIVSTLEQWIRALEECSRSLTQHLSNFKSFDHIWKYAQETNIWKWVSGNWKELHTQIHEDISILSKMMKISHNEFEEEVNDIWHATINHSSVQFYVEEFRSWLNMGPLEIMRSMWRNTFDFKVNKESEHLRIGVPLIKKAYSLGSSEMGVPEDLNTFSVKETLEAIIYESIISTKLNKCRKNRYSSIYRALL